MRKISYRFVYNRKKSLNDRGTALVQVEAYLNKKKVYFSTHVYLRPEQWDVKRKIIKDHPNQDALNGMLNEFIIELEKKELSLWRQGKTITLSLIKEEFKSNTDASFLGFARKEIMSSQLKDSTKRNHLTTISLLQSFKPTIEFEDLTYNFVTDFEKFLYESGYQTNTVAKHMKHLKSFVNAAINKGYIDPNNYAFRRYKIKMKEGKHVFLLPEEMKKLEEVSLIGRNSCLEHTLEKDYDGWTDYYTKVSIYGDKKYAQEKLDKRKAEIILEIENYNKRIEDYKEQLKMEVNRES